MSKVTTFQELRHKCAELYCPVNWTTITWANFFEDCLKLHVLVGTEFDENVLELAEIYNCSESVVNATIAFQRDYKMIKDYKGA